MAYATNADLVQEFPALAANGGFTTSTKVTAAQVDEWCTRASNLIDAKIGGKYSVPVNPSTSPNSCSLLKEICAWLVAPRIAKVLNQPTGDAKSSSGVGGSGAADSTKRAMDLLDEIRSGKSKLNDATLATSTDGVDSFTNDNASSLADLGVPKFTIEGGDGNGNDW